MNAVDTNILIYVHDRRSVRKQMIAELYSEDFDASAQAEGLEIVNPFAEPERAP